MPPERPAADEVRALLRRDPYSAAEAREHVRRLVRERDLDVRKLQSALLVTTELVTNALRHGEGDIELILRLDHEVLNVEVVDEGDGAGRGVRRRDEDEVGGWGLQIVDRLTDRWGVFEGTTHVWAELSLQPAP